MDIVCVLCFFILTIGLLVKLSFFAGRFRFYLKYFLYYVFMLLISVVILFLCLLSPKNVDNVRYFFPPLRMISWLLGIEFEVRGKENIPNDKPCILVSNHQASLDPLGMAAANLQRATFLARKENLVYYGPFGWATWLCGAIHIDRYNHKSAAKTIDNCTQILKNKNIKLWIYPEGSYIPYTSTFNPFKKGAFNIAVAAQIPIVPVVFSSYQRFHSSKEKRFDSGKVILTCLPPVSTIGMTSEDVVDLTEKVRNEMLDIFTRSTDELS